MRCLKVCTLPARRIYQVPVFKDGNRTFVVLFNDFDDRVLNGNTVQIGGYRDIYSGHNPPPSFGEKKIHNGRIQSKKKKREEKVIYSQFSNFARLVVYCYSAMTIIVLFRMILVFIRYNTVFCHLCTVSGFFV